MERKIFISQYLEILFIFCLIQGLALLAGYLYESSFSYVGLPSPIVFTTWQSAVGYILYIAIGGFCLAMGLKHQKRIKAWLENRALYKWIQLHSKLINNAFAFFCFLLVVIAVYYTDGLFLIYVGFIALCYVLYPRFPKNILSKILLIVVNIVFAFSLGIAFSFTIALFFFALLALYDLIAVFVTKHMLILAEEVQKLPLLNMIGIYISSRIYEVDINKLPEPVQKEYAEHKETWKQELEVIVPIPGQEGNYKLIKPSADASVASKNKALDAYKNGKMPALAQVGLGSGDLVFPAIITISALSISLQASLILYVGSVLGLIITFCVLNIYRKGLPAIPLIGIGILIALGVIYL